MAVETWPERRQSLPLLWKDPHRGPWRITLDWCLLDGRWECVGMAITSDLRDELERNGEDYFTALDPAPPQPLRTSLLRQIPLNDLLDRVRTVQRRVAVWIHEHEHEQRDAFEEKVAKLWMDAGHRDPRERRLQLSLSQWSDPNLRLRAIAEVYRNADREGSPPTKAVSEIFGISRDRAAKQVQACRRVGLLPPTKPGIARSAPEER